MIEAVRQRLGEFRDLPGPARVAKEKDIYAEELRRIIERELILDDMYAKLKKQGRLAIVDEIKEFAEKAADQSLAAIRKRSGITSDEEFQSMLPPQGLTLPVIRRQMERQIMADEYVRSAIKEKGRTPGFGDIRAYYEQHPDEFKTDDRVKWLDIFISFNKHATPQDGLSTRREGAAGSRWRGRLRGAGEAVRQWARDRHAGRWQSAASAARFSRRTWNERSGRSSPARSAPSIETPTGYHIVKVAEREFAGMRPFDVKAQHQIREKLLRQYREAEYHKLIEELWRRGVRCWIIEMP